jgi:hypothetical protein
VCSIGKRTAGRKSFTLSSQMSQVRSERNCAGYSKGWCGAGGAIDIGASHTTAGRAVETNTIRIERTLDAPK